MDDEQESSFYDKLPRAKTLCEREDGRVIAASRLSKLPLHVDSCLTNEEKPTDNTENQVQLDRLHTLPTAKLSQLFAAPIYCSSPKILLTECNQTFGQMRCRLRQLTTDVLPPVPYGSITYDGLEFESRFESGNLAMASRLSANEYVLLLQKDINTNSCTQWFLFRVRNHQQLGTIRFHLVNLTKKYSAYDDGMRICVFSESEFAKENKGWHRGCNSISYRPNSISRANGSYYSLSFEYTFDRAADEVYFANSYPYTSSRLQRYLGELEEKHPGWMLRRRLGETLSGNYIEMVTITNFEEKERVKPIMFVTARVHPGQTASSFVCEGLMNFLLGGSKEADGLRSQFIFKIVPMMNPDGVINGNYRCSLFGRDLNRQWKNPDKSSYPENYFVKKMMTESYGERLAYFDLHGHSKKRGVFAYGCRNRNNPYQCRQLPFLLHKQCKSFNYYGCNFNVSKVREGTGRVTVWRDLKIVHSYTLECSFFGPSARFRTNFVKADYRQIGEDLTKVLYQYFYRSSRQNTLNETLKELYASNDLLAIGNSPSEGSSSAESLEEFEKQSKSRKTPDISAVIVKEMSATFLPKQSPRSGSTPSTHLSHDYCRPRRFQQSDRYTPYETARLDQSQFSIPRPTGLKIPAINEIRMEITQQIPVRPHYQGTRRLPESVPRIDTTQKEHQSSFHEPSSYLNTRFDMTKIIFPSALRSEYTNYQRFRREELDFNVLFSDQAGVVRNRRRSPIPTNTNRVLDRIRNKKEIRSVSRKPRQQEKLLAIL